MDAGVGSAPPPPAAAPQHPTPPAAAGAAPHDPDELLLALRRNWRKVASTDNLSLLAEEEEAHGVAQGGPAQRRARQVLAGLSLIALGAGVLSWGTFSLVVSKLLPPSRAPLVAAIQQDWYYCYLVPLLLPVTYIAVTANWFSLKLFKHNS